MDEAWADIEKFLINLTFDGSPESSPAPWAAYSELEGFSEFIGSGVTPLAAVKNFGDLVRSRHKFNNVTHGVKNS